MLSKFFIALFLLVCSCAGTDESRSTIKSPQDTLTSQNASHPDMPESGFYCGYPDSKGNMWFGSRGGGVFRFDGKSFRNFTTADGLSDNNISCIAEDKSGNMWFGTTNGLCRFDGSTFTHMDIPQSDTTSVWLDEVYPTVNPNQVMSILEDSEGRFWIGTNGAGVYLYEGDTFTQHLSDIGMVYDDGEYHNIVLTIAEDQSGNIWFSSLSHGGVSRFDGRSFTHFVEELSDDFTRVVFCDSKGRLWIGTHGNLNGGLDMYDGQSFTRYYKTDFGFRHNNVRSIFEDKSGNLWLGSGTTELSIFDGEEIRAFTDGNGRTFENTIFVVGDSENNIWFGNREGLWRYDGAVVTTIFE